MSAGDEPLLSPTSDRSERDDVGPKGPFRCCYDDVDMGCAQLLFLILFIGGLGYIVYDFSTSEYILTATIELYTWLNGEDFEILAPIFFASGVVTILALVPSTIVFGGAGYLTSIALDDTPTAEVFGIACGLAFVTFAVGATLAFALGHTVMRSCARKFIRHFQVLQGIDAAIRHKGITTNILLRVNPVVPSNCLNYALGLTGSSLCAYVMGFIGTLPYLCVVVYAGMLLEDPSSLDDLTNLLEDHSSGAWIAVYVALGVFCLLSLWLMWRYVMAEMDAIMDHGRRIDASIHETQFGTFSASRPGDGVTERSELLGRAPAPTAQAGTSSPVDV